MDETVTILVSSGPDTPPEAVEFPTRVGSVKLLEMLGEGAGGVVFSGYDEALSRRVAVKLLRQRGTTPTDAATAELVEGVRSAARIKHPNIITVHTVDAVKHTPYIVMEFVDGVSFRDLLRSAGPLEPALAVHVMRSIVSAVAALHESNVVHRDLKPANILFDREGVAHVCDFGLACGVNAGAPRATTAVAGSPLYMAPEMFEGHVSPQSDVYALGVMLFEALSGRPPFSATTISEMRACHVAQAPPLEVLDGRGIPDELLEVLERSLHKQRYLRFKSASHMARSMDALSVTPEREEVYRTRVAKLVADAGTRKGERAAGMGESTPNMTTFDLIAQRAREKRDRRA